jgi:glucose/arabinose dehydrogenase
MGKILRLTDIGSMPSDNPFANASTFSEKAVYSLGHRNPQGLIVLPNKQIIAHEHGPAGGDEVNIIKAGENYGWPVVTQGKDYIGSLITPFTQYAGMLQPRVNWTPSIAPSGMVFYGAQALPQFTNRLLVTSLKFKQLHGLMLNGDIIEDEIVFFADSQHRMRDITVSSQGRVFILSDGTLATMFEVVVTQ